MIGAVALATVAVACFAWYAPRRAGTLPPRTATYLLAAGAVVSTVVTMGVLGLLAATAVAQLPPVARAGEWSRPDLRSSDPVPVWVASCCAALLVVAAALGTRQVLQRTVALRRLHRDCRSLGPAGSVGAQARVIVVDSAEPQAYATPVGGGRIVVTTGLLAALPAGEQQVLLAHEAAHLRHRHLWWVMVVELCAAVNPALRGVARATAQATERWADESAALVVGDREIAARAVARAALHVHSARPGRWSPATGAIGGQIPQRVHALLAPPPRPRRALTAGLALLLVVGLGCTAAVQRRTDAFFDLASIERPTPTVVAPAGHGHHSAHPQTHRHH